MVMEGTLSPEACEAALRFLGIRPGPRQWNGFWQRIFSSLGALFFASGVICFFAYNWAQMHHFAKFALIAALILVSGLAPLWRGLDSLPGKLALLLAALSVGPLLAVYGQTYQTGADAWELFRAWTLILVPLALAGRQAVLWLLVWLAGSAWWELYLISLPWWYTDVPAGSPELLLAYCLCLVGWEAAAHHWQNNAEHRWLAATWLPRIIGFVTLFLLTCYLGFRIIEGHWADYDNSLMLPRSTCAVLYALLLLGGWLWYRNKRPDLFMLSCGLFSLAALLVFALIKVTTFRWDVGSFLLWGLVIAGITAGCGFLLRRLQHAMESEKATKCEPQGYLSGFIEKFRVDFSWEDVWRHLREAQLLAEEPPPIPARSSTPWYISVLLALGGWSSAICLIFFLGLLVFTARIADFPQSSLLIGGLFFLALAWLLMRRDSIFTAQFALALAISGTVAVVIGILLKNNYRVFLAPHDPLLAAFIIAAIYPFMRNSAYRYLAAVSGLLLFFWGLDYLIWHDMYTYHWRSVPDDALREAFPHLHARQAMYAAWHSFLCVAMAYGWLTEHQWRTNTRLNSLLTPLLHGAYCALLVSVVVTLLDSSINRAFWMFEPLRGMVGIGAGVGLVYCVHMMTKIQAVTSLTRSLFLGFGILALIGGWFLPGLSVGLLGLALGRHRGDMVTLGVTVAALIAYFFCYYYNLNTSLLYKSISLMVSGAMLCAAAFCLYMVTKQARAAATGGEHA